MRFTPVRWVGILCILIAGPASVYSQAPHLASVYPAGGQRGTTIDVKLAGKNLKNVRRMFFSHPAITSHKVKGGQVSVAIAADVPIGIYDVWALTDHGVTNPRRFRVGRLPEIAEKEKNNDRSSAQTVAFPATINGTLNPGTDRDYYRLELKAGQLIHCQFRSVSLDGTARAALTLFGPGGNELWHDDGRAMEPALDFQVGQSGSYVLRIEERGFQKADNNVYQLSLFTAGRVVSAFPHILTGGKTQSVTLYGYGMEGGTNVARSILVKKANSPIRPLPLQKLSADIKAPKTGDADGGGLLQAHAAMIAGFRYRHPNIPGTLRFGLTERTVTLDTDSKKESMTHAQLVPFPCTVAGRFLRPREVDWYRVALKKGQSLWIETIGERAGERMDLEISIHDSKGKAIKTASDYAVKKSNVPVNTLDAMTAWKVPADGEYFVVVRDLYGTARLHRPRSYQLNVGLRLEEVTVVALPAVKTLSGFAIPSGGTAKLEFFALRTNGHQDAIHIHADYLPANLAAKKVTIKAKAKSATMTFSAKKGAAKWIGRIALVAETKTNGKPIKLSVVALTPVRTSTPPQVRRCQELVVAIVDKPKPKKPKKKK